VCTQRAHDDRVKSYSQNEKQPTMQSIINEENLKLSPLIKAAFEGTEWRSVLGLNHIWNEVRKNFPDEVDPSSCNVIEDIRSN